MKVGSKLDFLGIYPEGCFEHLWINVQLLLILYRAWPIIVQQGADGRSQIYLENFHFA